MALRHSTCVARFFTRLTKLAFQLPDALFDRGLSLVDQVLGQFARREIKRWTELRRRDPDDGGIKSFGELPRRFETSLVRLIKRQADHDGRVCHPKVSIAMELFLGTESKGRMR